MRALMSANAARDFVRAHCSRLSAQDKRLALEILAMHAEAISRASGRAAQLAAARSLLKPLQRRRAARTAARPLEVEVSSGEPGTFHAWLSRDPTKERLRDIANSARIIEGISRWPLGWLTEPGVICYERAEGRIRRERGGRITEDMVRTLVKTTDLPTALANTSDHYVVVAPSEPPRFMTVEEVARAFGLRDRSCLMDMLKTRRRTRRCRQCPPKLVGTKAWTPWDLRLVGLRKLELAWTVN